MAYEDVDTREESVHSHADKVLAAGHLETATLLRALLWRAQVAEHRLRVSQEIERGSDGYAVAMSREASLAEQEIDALTNAVGAYLLAPKLGGRVARQRTRDGLEDAYRHSMAHLARGLPPPEREGGG
jgi:hypothetical protein